MGGLPYLSIKGELVFDLSKRGGLRGEFRWQALKHSALVL